MKEVILTIESEIEIFDSMMMQFTPEEADTLSPMAAARFIQIENQLLMIIDLQLASNLPIVE